MRSVRFLLVLIFVFSLAACSSKGGRDGSGSATGVGDGFEDGNIPAVQSGTLELQDVNFAFDSSQLTSRAQEVLRNNSSWLVNNPEEHVIIEGHCDERGTAEYNLALGERRARSVMDFLRSLGVKSDQLSTISYGEELPLESGSNETAWSRNRRAHFTVRK